MQAGHMKASRLDKVVDWYLDQRNRLSKGLGFFYDLRQPFMWGFIASYAMNLLGASKESSVIILVCVSIFMTVFSWWLGLMWDRKGYWKKETEWSNQRNPFVAEVRQKFK